MFWDLAGQFRRLPCGRGSFLSRVCVPSGSGQSRELAACGSSGGRSWAWSWVRSAPSTTLHQGGHAALPWAIQAQRVSGEPGQVGPGDLCCLEVPPAYCGTLPSTSPRWNPERVPIPALCWVPVGTLPHLSGPFPHLWNRVRCSAPGFCSGLQRDRVQSTQPAWPRVKVAFLIPVGPVGGRGSTRSEAGSLPSSFPVC